MKKILITTALSFFICSGIFPQVGGIKKGSDTNKTTTTTTTTTTTDEGTNTESGSSGDGCLSDACGTACASGCFDWVLEYAILGIVKAQQFQLEKRDDIPEVVSLELMPHFGYAAPSSSLIIPRIRGNWGLFSTDFRYSNMAEYTVSEGVDFYNTIDWQILEFNVVVTEPAIFRVGGGIMHELYASGDDHPSPSTYMEYFLGLDANWMEHQYLASGEFRIAKDYTTGATPRLETNLRFNYRILSTDFLNGYAMLGGIYQNYYNHVPGFNSVDVWTVQAGFAFNFH